MVRTCLLTFDDVLDDIKGYKNWRVFSDTKMNARRPQRCIVPGSPTLLIKTRLVTLVQYVQYISQNFKYSFHNEKTYVNFCNFLCVFENPKCWQHWLLSVLLTQKQWTWQTYFQYRRMYCEDSLLTTITFSYILGSTHKTPNGFFMFRYEMSIKWRLQNKKPLSADFSKLLRDNKLQENLLLTWQYCILTKWFSNWGFEKKSFIYQIVNFVGN